MKNISVLFFILILACNDKKPTIEGAYILTAGQYGDSILSKKDIEGHKTIKIYKNSYWIAVTSIGTNKVSVEQASGGTYIVKDGQCIENINFTTGNDSDFGKSYNFSYHRQGNKYICKGKMINNICIDCEVKEIFSKIESDNNLRDTSLEGVWKLIESEWQGKKVEDSDYTSFKIYSYPRFIWGQYHAKGKNFIGAGGGTYQYDGKKLIEHVEYLSFYEMEPGDLTAIITTLSPGVIRQVSNDGMGKEIWEKVRQ